MAHELDITNGQASFVSAREDAWHKLGRTLDHAFTAEEAMTQGLLGGWDVRKVPMQAIAEDGLLVGVPNFQSVIRTNPVTFDPESLGVVSPRYTVIQNEAHAEFLNTLVDESGAHFETAGALYGGRQVFMSMKLQGGIRVGGVDLVENYLTAINSHDGSMAFTLMVTPVRVVCANTLAVALGNHRHIYRIRHTTNALARVQQAREALEVSWDYLDEFQSAANQLIDTTMTHARFMDIVTEEFGAPDDAHQAVATRRENKINELEELFVEASTQEGVRDTAWAGFNAITEWLDHYSPRQGKDKDASRALAAVMEHSDKTRALELMLAG